MKLHLLPGLCLLVLLAACEREATPLDGPFAQATIPGGGGTLPAVIGPEAAAETLPDAGAVEFAGTVDHPWFPLRRGASRVYAGDEEGAARRDEIRVLEQQRAIAGVACTGLAQVVFVDDQPVEFTTEWFAQDVAGNVWKFGEETLEVSGALALPGEDSWTADDPETPAWLFLPADPRPGDIVRGTDSTGGETLVVLSVTERVSVPAGTFDECLQVRENPDDPEDSDLILYGRGVGVVSEVHAGGRLDLVEVRDP